MSLFKNKWLAMMLLCGSMDLTYVDAMRRHPERKVDAAASCAVDGWGLINEAYRASREIDSSDQALKLFFRGMVPHIHSYDHLVVVPFAIKFSNGVYFDSLRDLLTRHGIACDDVQCAFFVLQAYFRSYEGERLLFRPHYVGVDRYAGRMLEIQSAIQAVMIENDHYTRLRDVSGPAQIHPDGNGQALLSPNSLQLILSDGSEVMHDMYSTRVVIYKMVLDGTPVIGMNILSSINDMREWDYVREQAIAYHRDFGDIMRQLVDYRWLSSCPSLFQDGAPLAAFLSHPTRPMPAPETPFDSLMDPYLQSQPHCDVSFRMGPESVFVPVRRAPSAKQNLHLRLCLPPEPEQPVVPSMCLKEAKLVPAGEWKSLSGMEMDVDGFALPKMPLVVGRDGDIDAKNMVSARVVEPAFIQRFSEIMQYKSDCIRGVDLAIMPAPVSAMRFAPMDHADRLGMQFISASMLIGNNDIRVRHNGCDIDPSILGDSTGYLCYSMAFHTGESDDPVFQHGVIVLLNRMDAAVWRRAIAQPEVTLRAVFQQCIGEDALTDILRAFNTSGILSPLFSWDD